MYKNSWFHIDSKYSSTGIVVTFFNQRLSLSSEDICYLLREIDVLASHLKSPPQKFSFELHGFNFEVNHEQWLEFIDVFTSVIFKAGWNSSCCKPYPQWLEELIKNQNL